MKIITLDIYSWSGLSLGAIHFYGELHDESMKSHGRLQRPLTEEDAIQINKRLRLTYSDEYYELYKVVPGELDHRFDREDQVVECAKSQWLNLFPDGEILIDRNTKEVYARAAQEAQKGLRE